MKISELIKQLEAMREEVGDIPVEARNGAGDFDVVEGVSKTHYMMLGEINWTAFIDV